MPALATLMSGGCIIKVARLAMSRASGSPHPHATDAVSIGQLYAWNPSITGAKMEDSMLVGEGNNEIITTIPGWPTLPAVVNGIALNRPAILEL